MSCNGRRRAHARRNAEQAHSCDNPPYHCVRAGGSRARAAMLGPRSASKPQPCARPCAAGRAPASDERSRE
eukprot:3263721-Alexandrium_andersonii.AAC.1